MIARFSLACLCALPALLLFAQPAAAQPLTLTEVLALAEAANPGLKAVEAQSAAAEAALLGARAWPNPEVEIAGGRSRSRQIGGVSGDNRLVGLAQPLELAPLRDARRITAEAGSGAAAAALAQARAELRAQVKQAYYEVLRRRDESALTAENRALLRKIRDLVKVRTEVGEAARYELVKAEAEALAAESAAESALFRVSQAQSALRALVAAPLPEPLELAAPSAAVAALPPLDALREQMRQRQPALARAEAETRRAQGRIDFERSLRLPQPTVKLSAEQDPDMRQLRLGVALPLPLWNQRQGPIGEAVAGLHQAEAESRRLGLALDDALNQAYSRHGIARRQIETFEAGLLKDAETALKVAEAAYRFGERGILDYLDAQRTYRTVRLDYLNARYELLATQTEIERLCATEFAGEKP
ncbi:MAG: TolC family protein [Pseudomonadota bacterium]